jgi:CHAT domain-containing protein
LPIHAAGVNSEWCSNYVVSSYTPTLGALITARAMYTPVRKEDVAALVAAVSMSHTAQYGDLLSACEETAGIKAILPKGTLISLPGVDNELTTEGRVTAGTLLEKLPEATILHLACHGHQDREDALKSGFIMSDEVLTIEKLLPIPLPRAFMAFLSACETAKGDKVRIERLGKRYMRSTLMRTTRTSRTK